MELLPDFLLTVAFSLFVAFVISFFFSMVLSLCPSRDVDECVSKRKALFECKPEIRGWETEIRSGFVEKVLKVEDFVGDEPTEDYLVVEDFVVECCGGSSEVFEGLKTDENEVGVVCLPDKSVEEESLGGDSGLCGCSENMDDQSPERHEIGEFEVGLIKNEVGISETEEMIKVLECDGVDHGAGGAKESVEDGVKKEEGLFGEEDDWEGIERTELERLFGAAVAFFGSKGNADRVSSVGSDVKMRLDGLHKIAAIGPCFEPQPMAFKVSARAKWNAWQQLGNMSTEVAMEQYITLLSKSVPGWMQDVHGDFADAQVFEKVATDLKAVGQQQSEVAGERKVEELKPDVKG